MMEPSNRRRPRRPTARIAIIACAIVLTVSGVALASLAKTHSAPPPPQTVVIAASPPRQLPATSHRVVPDVKAAAVATNRAAVYVPRPTNASPPTISGDSVQGQVLTETHGTWSSSPASYSYQWERCNSLGTACQGIAGATAQTYLLAAVDVGSTIRVQESASNESGQGSPAVSTQSATVQAAETQRPVVEPVPSPILGRRGTATVLAGTVRIRLKGTDKFVSLSGSTGIPNGSEVDVTHGRVLLTVASAKRGHTSHAEVYGGIFEFNQYRAAHALAHLALSLPLTGCPRPGAASGRNKPSASGAAHSSGAKSRHLWVSDSGGSWGTNGRYVSTTVEGTHWLTLDQCDRSEVTVAAGKVEVHNLVDNKTKTITTGETYVAAHRP
jgi:hypothetical protein